ncbi:MAG: alpha-mannosidase, partial [Eisenbergiella sp.]
MFFEKEKFRQRAAELEGRRWTGMQSVDWFYTKEGGLDADEVYTSCPEAFAGDKIRLGDEFAGRDRYIWLQREITIPEEKEGCKVMGYFNFGRTGGGGNSGFEALLYINGQPFQGVDTNHREVVLTPFAGQTVLMTFLLWSGLEGGGPVRTQYHRIAEAQIG